VDTQSVWHGSTGMNLRVKSAEAAHIIVKSTARMRSLYKL
jgi:hypothetical protein